MEKQSKFATLATTQQIEASITALTKNGITALSVKDGAAAKAKIFEILPEGAEVMNMTSATLDTIGVSKEILESGKYNPVRLKLMDKSVSENEKRKLGGGPDWTMGSVHAATEDGHLVIASNTGSQLGAYAYGAGNVIFVIGTQKIVKNLDEATQRIYEYVLPLESKRANAAYNITTGSFVSKMLVINREIKPGRITVIFVEEVLGF